MRTLWAAAIALFLVAPHAVGQSCGPGKTGLVAENDPVVWPRDVAAGQPFRIEVLANDRDYAGGNLTIVGAPVLSDSSLGQVSIGSGNAVVFTPATPQTYPGAGRSITYNVSSTTGASASAKVVFYEDAESLPPTISFQCQELDCYFTATAGFAAGIRSYDWTFEERPACSKRDWRGRTTLCSFPPVSGDGKAYMWAKVAVNYLNGKRVESERQRLSWTPSAPDLTWWWHEGSSEVANQGLAVVADVRCPKCNACTGYGDGDSLWWNWGEVTGATDRLIMGDFCRGGALGSFPEDVEFSYADPGRYWVQAVVNRSGRRFSYPDPDGAAGMWVEIVNAPPQVTVNATNALGGSVATVSADVFDDAFYWSGNAARPIRSIVVDWGDGETYQVPGPFTIAARQPVRTSVLTHAYKALGKYTIGITATDYHGAESVSTKELDVTNLAPEPVFTFNCVNLTCTFDGSGSTDNETPVTDYYWSAEGWTTATTTSAHTHTFSQAGTYRVRLRVEDETGLRSAYYERDITVVNGAAARSSYYALPIPCRIYDTRAYNGAPKEANEIFQFTSNTELADKYAYTGCGAPLTAKALVMNMTVVTPTGPGNLALADTINVTGGEASLPLSSVLTFDPATSPRSNTVIADFRNGFLYGKFSIGAAPGQTASAHYVADLVGYYDAPAAWCPPDAACDLAYRAVQQCRVVDTRQTGGVIAVGTTRTIAVMGQCGVPAVQGPRAVASTVTTVPQADGSILVHDGNKTVPAVATTSTANYKSGRTHTAVAFTPIGAAGALGISARYGATHAVVEANGYFGTRAALGSAATLFHPLTPCRAFDSRYPHLGSQGRIVTGKPSAIQISGNCGVPRNAKSAVVTITAVRPDGSGYLRAYTPSETPPVSSTMNFQANDVVSNTTVVALGTAQKDLVLDATVFSADVVAGVDVVVDVFGYYAPAQ